MCAQNHYCHNNLVLHTSLDSVYMYLLKIYKAILEINKKVALKSTRKSPFLGVECGLFHENLIHIKDYVAIEKRKDLNLYGLSYTLQTFIQHALELSLSVSKT